MTQQNSQNKRNAFSRKISKLNKGFRQNLFQIIIKNLAHCGGFHLHLLVFPFIYQFHCRIEALVCSSFENDYFRRISALFQHHFEIRLLWLLHEKECSFYTYPCCCTEIRWLFISSSAVWGTGSVASRSKCGWTRIWTIKSIDETTLYLILFIA